MDIYGILFLKYKIKDFFPNDKIMVTIVSLFNRRNIIVPNLSDRGK